jgi:hypothetical protein
MSDNAAGRVSGDAMAVVKLPDNDKQGGKKTDTTLLYRLATASKGVALEDGRLPPAWISEYVIAQSEWASQLLRDLAQGASVDRLNAAVLNSAEGLAFIRTRKGALDGTKMAPLGTFCSFSTLRLMQAGAHESSHA